MKNFKLLFLISVLFLFAGCFDQVDNVTINSSGRISMTSIIEVTKEDAEKDDVKKEISSRVADLEKEGWSVKQKWIKKSKPYKIKFTLVNSVHYLYKYQQKNGGDTPSGVWVSKKFRQNEYIISFDKVKDADSRTVSLSSSSLPLYRHDSPGDADRKKLKSYRKITSDKQYYLLLNGK